MKMQCLVIGILILAAIMTICVMVKFSTELKEKKIIKELMLYENPESIPVVKSLGVISLVQTNSKAAKMAEMFPYTTAILRNSSSTWSFACFGSLILIKWVVTTAKCRKAGFTHRALTYFDYVNNHTRTYPILFWRIHENFEKGLVSAKYDIALVKLNIKQGRPLYLRSAVVAPGSEEESEIVASVWKTVASMDGKQYLTNDLAKYDMRIAQNHRCYESYGIALDESMFCVDMSEYDDCFAHDFGPIYYKDRVVGICSIKPRECDSKLSIFTNVSWYSKWIYKSTGSIVPEIEQS
ncbi:trypsin domain-containing protein [Phthorimaea operculella]|nr:trypsin domain-containing protein [Phthorimaea operculella]